MTGGRHRPDNYATYSTRRHAPVLTRTHDEVTHPAVTLRSLHSHVSAAVAGARVAGVELTAARSRLLAVDAANEGVSDQLLAAIGRIDHLADFAQSRLELADKQVHMLARAIMDRDRVCGSPIVVCCHQERIQARDAVARHINVALARMGQAEATSRELYSAAVEAVELVGRADATIDSWFERQARLPAIAKVIRILMPQECATEWWRETASILAECSTAERRRNIHSLILSAPSIVGTAWVLRVAGRPARQRDRD